MKLLWNLFLTFSKIGLFTFGGGYAMISMIEDACVEKKKWITHDDMMNITVVAESTPGPIAINCATFVGYKQKGFAGAVTATVGMVLPSFVVILLIAKLLDNFLGITIIANALVYRKDIDQQHDNGCRNHDRLRKWFLLHIRCTDADIWGYQSCDFFDQGESEKGW